jgi:hypothetical protein
MIRAFLRWWRRPLRPVRVTVPPLDEAELRTALLVGDDHLLWRAIIQCIDVLREESVRAAIEDSVQERPELMHHFAGGAATLDRLKAFLLDQREKAKTMRVVK